MNKNEFISNLNLVQESGDLKARSDLEQFYRDVEYMVNLEEYPDEDLHEDGELTRKQVEQKILDGWYYGSIILMREKGYDEIQNVIEDNKRDTL